MARFGFAGDLLEVDQLRDMGMSKDVVATTGALENETNALDQTDKIRAKGKGGKGKGERAKGGKKGKSLCRICAGGAPEGNRRESGAGRG